MSLSGVWQEKSLLRRNSLLASLSKTLSPENHVLSLHSSPIKTHYLQTMPLADSLHLTLILALKKISNCFAGSFKDPNPLVHLLFVICASMLHVQNCLTGNGSKGRIPWSQSLLKTSLSFIGLVSWIVFDGIPYKSVFRRKISLKLWNKTVSLWKKKDWNSKEAFNYCFLGYRRRQQDANPEAIQEAVTVIFHVFVPRIL